VEAVDARGAPLDETERRVPHQRAEAEHPDAPRARRRGEHRFDLRLALGVGEKARARPERRAHDRVQRAVEDELAGELHRG
jgi:hypothetical protein